MSLKRLAAVVVIAGAGVIAGLLLRGGHSDPAVAHVGGETITHDQLAIAVDHFRTQAKQEGTPFPDEDSARFRTLRNRLLGVLVYRAELSQAARRLGMSVTNVQVLRRLNAAKGAGEAEVTRGITAPTTAELAARKNAAMGRHIDRLERETQVRYEPGYAPGP
jgi:SurA N-terminal domain